MSPTNNYGYRAQLLVLKQDGSIQADNINVVSFPLASTKYLQQI